MRSTRLTLLVLAAAALSASCGGDRVLRVPAAGPVEREKGPALSDLQQRLERPLGPVTIELAPGVHDLAPVNFREEGCLTCDDPAQAVAGTRGLRVTGRGVRIVAAPGGEAILRTNAGYGVLFENCVDCVLENVTVTGGARDLDIHAPSAAVVVSGGSVTVRGAKLSGNTGKLAIDPPHTLGISGAVVRGGELALERCEIVGNSGAGAWVARGGRATIRGCQVDGVDKGYHRGRVLSGGGGAGVLVDFDGRAVLEGTWIQRTWMGVRVLRDGALEARRNAVEDVDSVGLLVDDVGSGRPHVVFEDNAIVGTGACGARLVRAAPGAPDAPSGSFRRNALALTGQNSRYDPPDVYCRQVALDAAVPGDFAVADNAFFRNRESHDAPGERDLSLEGFRNNTTALRAELAREPALQRSRFLQVFR